MPNHITPSFGTTHLQHCFVVWYMILEIMKLIIMWVFTFSLWVSPDTTSELLIDVLPLLPVLCVYKNGKTYWMAYCFPTFWVPNCIFYWFMILVGIWKYIPSILHWSQIIISTDWWYQFGWKWGRLSYLIWHRMFLFASHCREDYQPSFLPRYPICCDFRHIHDANLLRLVRPNHLYSCYSLSRL